MRHGGRVKTLAAARREFLRERSPRILFAGVAIALAVRLAVGDFGWRDLVAVALMVPVYALGEWAIHVHLLHLPPFRWRGREVELITAKGHRQHHEDPNNLNLIVLGIVESLVLYLVAVPVVVGAGCLLIGLVLGPVPLPAALTAGLTAYVLILAYEWVHFLIHTGVRPRSRYYRAIWRGHRLHHFKNERYWHGITNTVSDRVLGTAPDQRSVPRSPTARTLRP
jgi:sterol desaturase/sphingolipid hydroxylase (fatty acid hydroxylase superfamily)